jgi:energy-coupling factor transporter ATP-binding protein EcfA2
VALAGVIARRPRLLVLDEPLAGLDAPSRRALIDVLRRLTQSEVTTVLVTHDTEDAHLLADRALALRDGRVVADGPVAQILAGARS